jgi:hypothetical protein
VNRCRFDASRYLVAEFGLDTEAVRVVELYELQAPLAAAVAVETSREGLRRARPT